MSGATYKRFREVRVGEVCTEDGARCRVVAIDRRRSLKGAQRLDFACGSWRWGHRNDFVSIAPHTAPEASEEGE